MPSIVSLNADSRSTSPARNPSLFPMADGSMIAIWVEGRNGPGTDRVIRRYRSTDGVTWTKLSDYSKTLNTFTVADGAKFVYPLFVANPNGFIYGFNIQPSANTSQSFRMSYDSTIKDFFDYAPTTYTATNAWDALQAAGDLFENSDLGMMLYDTVKNHVHVVFGAYVAGAAYTYLIALDVNGTKVTETRFTTSSPLYPYMAINTAASPKVFITYLLAATGVPTYRSFTYDGATYTAADAAETINATGAAPLCFLNNNGNLQVVYTDAGSLKTRERTGVATYSAAVTIGTNLPSGNTTTVITAQDSLALAKVPGTTDDWYVFYKRTASQFAGELYYVRRNAGAWGPENVLRLGAGGFNHPTVTSLGQTLSGNNVEKIHLLYSRGSAVYPVTWSLYYDFVYDGKPDAPTNVTPSTRGETSLTPTITAKYVQPRAGDNLARRRIVVTRPTDGTVMWDNTADYVGATVAPGGTLSVVYAGTALSKGVDYIVQVATVDDQERYTSALSGPVRAFEEDFTDLSKWTLDAGTAFTVADKIATGVAGSRMLFGTPWWDISTPVVIEDDFGTGTRFRLQWKTGGTFTAYVRWVDSNNNVFWEITGTTMKLWKRIAGTLTQVGATQTIALISGQWVWLEPWITGTSYSAALEGDANGTPGVELAELINQTIADAAVKTGRMALEISGATMSMGGAYTDTWLVKIAAPIFAVNDQPSKIAVALTSDPTNGRQRTALYPLAPTSTEKAPVTADLWRKLSTDAQFTSLKSGLAFTAPTTQTGFSAYRQLPEKIGRNLIINGGFLADAHGWVLHANASVVADSSSPTGYAVRLVSTGAGQVTSQTFNVEAGKAYSFACQGRSDGSMYLDIQWFDGGGNFIAGGPSSALSSSGAYVEIVITNTVAPGNARKARMFVHDMTTAGVAFITAVRGFQQTAAAPAWTAAHQAYLTRGLAIYEASTNLATDGDMEAVGTASYGAVVATLTKDTVTFFAGAKALQVASTGVDGRATQNGALAAGQAIAISVRAKGGDANCRLDVISTPSNASIGTMNNPNTTDWNTLRVTGTIAGGDTGYSVRLVAGANTIVAYFDNLAVENKAYDTMNADPSGQAFAVASRTASSNVLPLQATIDPTVEFVILIAGRYDHAHNLSGDPGRYVFELVTTGNNRIFSQAAVNGLSFYKSRAGALAFIATAGSSFVAGDTFVIYAAWSRAAGFVLSVRVNGGAPETVTLASPEALLPIASAAASFYLGRSSVAGVGFEMMGTIGVVRFIKTALSAMARDALTLDPYQQPTDNDLAVWQFEDFASTVPSSDDRLVKLGTSYDYRAVGTAAAATPTQSTGQQISGSVAVAAPGQWWLKDASDSTKDTTLEVIDEFPYAVPRRTIIATPLAATRKVAIRAQYPTGAEGKLRLRFTNTADQVAKEAALRALQASDNDLYLQSPFGQLWRVVLPDPIGFNLHDVQLEVDLAFIEI